MKLVSVRLLVVDFATEMRFWRDVIGLKMAFGDEASGYAYFETGSTAGLELFGRDAFAVVLGRPVPAPARGNEAIVSFEVDDVDAAYSGLRPPRGHAACRPE